MSTEENKAIVRRYQEAYNTNNLDALDALVAVDLISHDLAPGLPQGLASGKLVHQRAVAAMPDYQAVIEDLIAEGEKVVARMTIKGTHSAADFLGLPASGRRINVPAISIFRIANGKIVEHWAASDTLGLLQQLGALPAP
jgi:C-1 hydroxylase